MTNRTLLVAAALAMLSTAPVQAQDIAAGEKTYKKVCRACHGPKAQGMASFPRLTGHDVEFLVTRLEQYRAGEKIGPNTALMAPNAAKLSDEDILDVSTFIVTSYD